MVYKTILECLEEAEMLSAHNEGAGHEMEVDALMRLLSKMDKRAIWASPHRPTKEQIQDIESNGYVIRFLVDTNPELFQELSNLTIDSDREALARKLLRADCDLLLQPAGDPAFQFLLGAEKALAHKEGVKTPRVLHAFSHRVSKDIIQPNGALKKISTFKFEGWI
jgi:hypothetical protein